MPSTIAMTTSANPPTISPETLEADLLAHLASSTALEDLHASLLCSLQRIGWTDKIRRLSLELLRAGRCENFDELLNYIVTLASMPDPPTEADKGSNTDANGSFIPQTGIENANGRSPRPKRQPSNVKRIPSSSDRDNKDRIQTPNAPSDLGRDATDPVNAAINAIIETEPGSRPPSRERSMFRIPASVVHEGVRNIKNALSDIVSVEDEDQQHALDAAGATSTSNGSGQASKSGKKAADSEAGASSKALKSGDGASAAVKKTIKKDGKKVKG